MKTRNSQSSLKKYGRALGEKVKSFDSFGESISLKMEGQSTHKTYLGSFLSILIIAITYTYVYKRYVVMTEFDDSTHQTTFEKFTSTRDAAFGQEETGFNFAPALIISKDNGEVLAVEPGYLDI